VKTAKADSPFNRKLASFPQWTEWPSDCAVENNMTKS